jgi:glycerol-3-phosphate acyltransferase PlsY
MNTLLRVLVVLSGYLTGSIPFAYLAGRLIRGIDIRQYGSRAVTGSNVYENVSRPAVIVVGLLDMGKAALPTWLGLRLGLGLPTALAAGLAAVIGHNWPLYLGFHGGRGIGSCLGVLTVAFPPGLPWMLVALALGWRLRNPVLPLAGFVTLPVFAHTIGQPPATVWACAAMLLLIVTKRLEANRQPLPEGREKWQILLRRLLLDRDIDDWETWAHRRPTDLQSEEE